MALSCPEPAEVETWFYAIYYKESKQQLHSYAANDTNSIHVSVLLSNRRPGPDGVLLYTVPKGKVGETLWRRGIKHTLHN
jgi:hypothetical protein